MIKKIAFHPFLLAISPILALYATNVREIEIIAIVRSIVFSILLAGVIYLFSKLLFGRYQVESFVTSFLILFFFSFGHIQKSALIVPGIGSVIGRSVFLIPVIAILITIAIILIVRNKDRIVDIHLTFNIFAAIMVIIPLAQIGNFEISRNQSKKLNTVTNPILFSNTTNKPNIYYIILDSYGRQDDLLEKYKFDNSNFIQQLRDMGFYVADCSLSNYSYTPGSIGSTLNMGYLFDVTNEPPESKNLGLLYDLVASNKVRQTLHLDGYKIVGFDTGYNWINWSDADIYYGNPSFYITDPFFYPFETLLIDTTALRVLEKHDMISIKDVKGVPPVSYVQSHVKKTMNVLNNLKLTATLKGPNFVYAHILVPHTPYIFNTDGSASWENYFDEHTGKIGANVNVSEGYVRNTQFINNQMLGIIKSLLENSDPDPVIILQGDHALDKENRFPILNAYYFPDHNYKDLYRSISPVNSYRVIFNKYFGTELPLLKDVSIANDINDPFGRATIDEQTADCKN